MATWEEERGPNYHAQHCAHLNCKWCRERRDRKRRQATVQAQEAVKDIAPWERKISSARDVLGYWSYDTATPYESIPTRQVIYLQESKRTRDTGHRKVAREKPK